MREASECFQQSNVFAHADVCSFALVNLVRLDTYHHLYIPSLDPRHLVTFSIKGHHMFIRSPWLHIHLQVLLPVKYLLAFALFAYVCLVHSLAFSSAVLAWLLYMLVHPGA